MHVKNYFIGNLADIREIFDIFCTIAPADSPNLIPKLAYFVNFEALKDGIETSPLYEFLLFFL